jgi:hypothetical protein
MLRFAQHDKGGVVPHALFCHSERQRGIHSWMLRFAQHDSRVVVPNTLFCHSERMRGIQYGCFTSFSMTNQASVDASLRSA